MMTSFPWLSLVIWFPIIGGIFVLVTGDRDAQKVRWIALAVAILTFLAALPLYIGFDVTSSMFQFETNLPWIVVRDMHINYHVGVDGFSMPFVILTSFITILVVIAAWKVIENRASHYLAAFLILTGLMNGIFASVDVILFYIFFEAMLIPMFLIIGIWGGPGRVQAALKFFVYTFLGSIFMLVALIYLGIKAGSFNIVDIYALSSVLDITTQKWIFLALLAGFAVKVPMWPVHTWLPSAHVEAPTGGSVVLAAITLKIGGYGFVRFMLPIVPNGVMAFDWLIITLSLVAILYISLVALVQQDMKKLIAYSSIAHMGFVTLAFILPIVIYQGTTSPEAKLASAQMALQGGMIQMISHGFVSAAMFLCIGVLYDRVHSRQIKDYGGVVNRMPVFAAFFVFFAMANSGLPGTSGFVGEFWVILASFHYSVYIALLVAVSIIFSAAYNLWLTRRVIFGEVTHAHIDALKDLDIREWILLSVLAFLVVLLGVWPAPFASVMQASIDNLISHFPFYK